MIVPLRYDILIRKNFLEFYTENKRLFIENFDSFFEKAKLHQYYDFIKLIKIARNKPEILDNESLLMDRYKKYVLDFINLYESISKNGFNKKYPIGLKTTADKSMKYYIGDGCHRLTCLMSMGYDRLPSDFVKIKKIRNYSPRNNTKILFENNQINREEYFLFLSKLYADGEEINNCDELVIHVQNNNTNSLENLISIIERDGMMIKTKNE